MLIIKASSSKSEAIINLMRDKKRCELKTESYKNDVAELTYEIANRTIAEDIIKMKNDEGIININLIEID